MVSELLQLQKRERDGFTSLIKATQDKAFHFHFDRYETDVFFAEQKLVQKASYDYISYCFSLDGQPNQDIQNFLANSDIAEINFGFVDLSAPYLNTSNITQSEIDRIIGENNSILKYLKNPLPENFNEVDYSLILSGLYKKAKNADPTLEEDLNNFFKDHEILLLYFVGFAQILRSLCVSQSFYAFSYHLQKTPIISEIFEFLICCNTPVFNNTPFTDLASRYSNIFLGNLSLRVFGKENIDLLSQMSDLSEIE